MIKKILAKVLAGPIRVYNQIKIKNYYNALDLEVEELGNLGMVLIIAPHVDDEAIGLGGLLAGQSRDSRFDLLYGTDSGASNSGLSREETSRVRFLEAENLAKDLDIEIVGKMLELRNEEEDWPFEVFKETLSKLLTENTYDAIFTVSMVDAHPEHQRLTDFLGRFLKDFDYGGDIYLYEVSNLLPNQWINTYYVMSQGVWAKKKQLYNHFGSQKSMDFGVFNKLNQFKGLAIGESRPVEFFARMNKDEFVDKVEKLQAEDLQEIVPFRIGGNTSFYKVINREKDVQRMYESKGW